MTDEHDVTDPTISAQEKTMTVDQNSGTQIFTESKKTVFGNWMQTDPGATNIATIVYKIPTGTIQVLHSENQKENTKPKINYSLLIQKQPGTHHTQMTTTVELPRGYHPLTWNGDWNQNKDGSLILTNLLEKDTKITMTAQ